MKYGIQILLACINKALTGKDLKGFSRQQKRFLIIPIGNKSLTMLECLQKIAECCPVNMVDKTSKKQIDHFQQLKALYMSNSLEGINAYVDAIETAIANALNNAKEKNQPENSGT